MTTPEPELNVEAELDARIWHIVQAYGKSGDSELDKACRYRQHDEIVVLIQQVSDQRMREFSKRADTELNDVFVVGGHKFNKDIYRITKQVLDRTLADYLSHKEQSHD